MAQGLEVEAGAANQDGLASGHSRGFDLDERPIAPKPGRGRFRGRQAPIEPMRNARRGRRIGLSGQDGQFAIELERIGINDGASKGHGEVERQRALAAGGRTGNDPDRLSRHGRQSRGLVAELAACHRPLVSA